MRRRSIGSSQADAPAVESKKKSSRRSRRSAADEVIFVLSFTSR